MKVLSRSAFPSNAAVAVLCPATRSAGHHLRERPVS
jgi:hypothetical protein